MIYQPRIRPGRAARLLRKCLRRASIVWVVRAPRLAAIAAAVASLTWSQAHAQLSGAAAQPQSLDGPWGLRFAPQLEEHLLRLGQAAVEFGLGDMVYGVSATGIALKGHGEIRVNATVVKGDVIYYDEDTDVADAYGNVHVVRNGDVFVGPEAHLRIDASEGYMTAPKYHFNLTNGSGSAARIDIVDNDRSVIHQGTYTGCQCVDDPAWYVKASRFDIDNGTNVGVARNGVIFFEGVPIFASPWLSFPLNGDRRSGVLPPTFSVSSTNGEDIELPYYFNLAPNYDLTLTPRFLSKRGGMLSEDFRYLSPDYSGSLSASFLPDDAITKTNRYAITFIHNQNLGNGFGAYVNYNRVSDSNVTTDLAEGSAVPLAATTEFQQEAGLTYNDGPWSMLFRDQHWQSFTTSPSYNREPEVDVKYAKYNVAGFDFGAEADATRFTIDTAGATEGSRLVFNPYVSYPIVHPGWFFTPKLQWHFAAYDLTSISSSAPTGQPKTFSYNVPTLTLDSGMVFERSVNLFGTSYIQTLEPRLYYVYTPYRNQTFAPIFDTAQADFGLAEIFTSNTFVGGDRVADLNRLTSGLTTRFIDPSTGDERARFTIAQEYYFTNPEVTLVEDDPETDLRGASLAMGTSFKVGRDVSAEQSMEYDERYNRIDAATVGFTWKPADREVVNFGYRYIRDNTTIDDEPENQVILSAQWPLTRNLSTVGRFNYDMLSHHLIAGLLGVQYDAQCWSLSLAVQKYSEEDDTTGEPTSGTRVLLQLQLKGFSRIDNGLLQQFQSSVPGYTALPSTVPADSRFSDYQ